jgi:hypothetical protein
MNRNEIRTPGGIFPIPEGIAKANQEATDIELLESLYVFGDYVDPFVFHELLYREIITGGETKADIEALIEYKKTGKKPPQKQPISIIDVFNRVVESHQRNQEK